MTGKMKIMPGKGEYWLVNLVIAVTMIVWFVTGLLYANVMAPEMVLPVLGGTVVVALVILIAGLYSRMRKVTGDVRDYYDERSDRCSLKATRNAFMVTLVFLALYMILGQWKPDSLYRIQALQGVFGVAVAAYVASYFYYKQVS